MKRAFKKLLFFFLSSRIKRGINFMGPRRYFGYYFFQRIIRVNSRVPWPVHHSSVVTQPDRIKNKDPLHFPGYMLGSYIQAINGIEFGSNVLLGPNVHIVSASHDLLDYDSHPKGKPIVFGDNCWVGAGATILPEVQLGDHVVVAAGSVVTKSFPSNVLIGGVPAKVLKELGEYTGKTKQQ